MSSARLDVEKFSRKNDFGLWRIKMRAMLIQQGLGDAIKDDADKGKGAEDADEKAALKKQEMLEKAHSVLILCLADNVLREVSKETTAAGIWAKLAALYMTKSLANRLYMKQTDVKLEDEDKAIILLSALPKSFDHLRDAMLYGREKTITLEEVQCALKSKELRKNGSNQDSAPSQALNVKGQNKGKKKKSFQNQKPQHQKQVDGSGKETRSCHYCKKPGHLKSLKLELKDDFELEVMLEKIGSLLILEKFKLGGGCFGSGKWEISEGKFPRLKYLSLYSCRRLEHWTTEASSIFPRLEKLSLVLLIGLENIPSEIGYISTLQNIQMLLCGESVVKCAKEIVEEQMTLQGDDLPFHVHVRHPLDKDEASKSLVGPNFEVVYRK